MPGSEVFRLPRTILTGWGVLAEVGSQARALGVRHAFVVTDRGVAATGLIDKVMGYLAQEGIQTTVFDAVPAEPPFRTVEAAGEQARAAGCDGVVGCGGGSSLDCAKGVALLAAGEGPISELAGARPVERRGLPTIMVPTTAGTGSEVTGVAIYTDETSQLKVGVASPHIVPDVAVVDPAATLSAPRQVTALAGIDALVHAVEAYVSVNATPLTDGLAAEAIQRIAGSLREAVADGSRLGAREAMAYGSLLAGMAFANAGVGAAHALAYPLGARYHLPHGMCTGMLLPAVMQGSWTGNVGRYARIATLIGENVEGLSLREAALQGIEAVRALSRDIGMPERLRDLGVEEAALRPMAEAAVQVTRLMKNNPRKLTVSDVERIYQAAY